MPSILGETPENISAFLSQHGQPAYRTAQILEWLYKKRAAAWDAMTNLPKPLRALLSEHYTLNPAQLLLEKKSADITDKLLLRLHDNALVETVIIRAPQEGVGVDNSRQTLCISTQVGCAMGCAFCASGLDGLKRNLTAAEILSQILHASRLEADKLPPWDRGASAPQTTQPPFPSDSTPSEDAKQSPDAAAPNRPSPQLPFDNLVVMGMGEPLANYDATLAALRALNAPWGFNFGARRITLSTSGIVPQILRLADEPLSIRLAVSLHAATDDIRDQIMPVNKAYPLAKLLPAIKTYSEKKGRMVTLEYILIDNLNDTPRQAAALVEIARDLHAHVNLIPYNTVETLPYKRPGIETQNAFHKTLLDARISATLRREKGHDIDAACGQLRLKTERQL